MTIDSQPSSNDVSQAALNNAIAVLVARLGEQLQLAERIDAKGRQVVAVCVAFFAGAQALAFTSFAESDVTTGERLILLGVALVATVTLIRVGELLFRNERPRGEDSFSAEGLVGWFGKSADEGDEYVSRQLVINLARASDSRAEVNEGKYDEYVSVLVAARWSLLLVFVESVVAIGVRV